MKAKIGMALVTLVALGMLGCKAYNDNPMPKSVQMDLGTLQSQMGFYLGPDGNITTSPSNATTEVKSLVFGAMVVRSRDTAYSPDEPLTQELKDEIQTDILNSVTYFQLVNLPIQEDSISMQLPPESAGAWQLVAVGLTTQPASVSELNAEQHTDAVAYYGFGSDLLLTADVEEGITFDMTMKRACYLTVKPNGCAIFGPTLAFQPVVTGSVEIVGIKANDQVYVPGAVALPIIVPYVGEGVQDSFVQNQLLTIQNEAQAALGTLTSLSVIATHRENPAETTACQNTGDVAADLIANCEEVENRIAY